MKFNWGHAVVVVMITFMSAILYVVYSVNQMGSDLVTEDYYADTLVYQEVIDAKNNLINLGEKVEIINQSEGLEIVFPSELKGQQKGTLVLLRPSGAVLDVKTSFDFVLPETLLISKEVLVDGVYYLELKWESNTIPYYLKERIYWKKLL